MQSKRNQINDEGQLWSEMTHALPRVVAKYASRKAIPVREKEDVELFVLEKLLKKRKQIWDSYRGEASFKTYSIAIINRMVCEVIRKESKHWYALDNEVDLQNELKSEKWDAEKDLYLKSEYKRYQLALRLFEKEGCKEHLFFKYYFELRFSNQEIENYASDKTDTVEKMLKEIVTSKAEKFEQLVKVVNLVEQKDNKADAVRIWLNKQMETTIKRLNSHGNSSYDKETLGILLEIAQVKSL